MIRTWIKQNIFVRITSRLSLSATPSNDPLSMEMSGLVVPVTNVDELLKTFVIGIPQAGYDPGGNGFKTMDTIPAGKRRKVKGIYAYKTGATLTFDQINVGPVGGTMPLVIQVAATSVFWIDTAGLMLDQNWVIILKCVAYTAGDTLSFEYYYEEENAY